MPLARAVGATVRDLCPVRKVTPGVAKSPPQTVSRKPLENKAQRDPPEG